MSDVSPLLTAVDGAQAPASDADRLAADGAKVRLSDGKTYRLRFGFRALRQIEKDFDGGLQEAVKVLQTEGWTADQMTAVSNLMVAALLANWPREATPDHGDIIDLLEFENLYAYLDALVEAFNQAMPKGPSSPNGQGGAKASPGRSSTTPRRSRSAAATRRSGT